MSDLLFLLFLVAALAIGWWLGRRELSQQRIERFQKRFDSDYFNGLQYLIDNRADEAIDSFIKTVQRDSGSIPVRLALGVLLRRRGEVDRALQLHQDVLASGDLSVEQRAQARLLLSQDYRAAGLQDRAEALLLELVEEPDAGSRQQALELLVQLYQQQKEWQQALSTAGLIKQDSPALNLKRAHFCCELAQQSLDQQLWDQARQQLEQALKFDPGSVRAGLMLAQRDIDRQHWKRAIKRLVRVEQQDPAFVSESVPLLLHCYQQLEHGDPLPLLMDGLKRSPSAAALVAIAELMQRQRGDYQASIYVAEQLKHHPSLQGFKRLIDLQLGMVADETRDSLLVLRGLVGQLEQARPHYRCVQCGFTGKLLHWLCPSCQHWGVVKPIQGLDLDRSMRL